MQIFKNKISQYKINNIRLGFSQKRSCFFLNNNFGSISIILMPSIYFIKQTLDSFSFLFLNNLNFKSFLINLQSLLSSCLYFVKIRISGLGYRYRSLCLNVHYFFFNYTISFIFLIRWIF